MMALDRSSESFPHKINFYLLTVPTVPTCDPKGVANFDPRSMIEKT